MSSNMAKFCNIQRSPVLTMWKQKTCNGRSGTKENNNYKWPVVCFEIFPGKLMIGSFIEFNNFFSNYLNSLFVNTVFFGIFFGMEDSLTHSCSTFF